MDTQTQRKNWEKVCGKSVSEQNYKEICDNLSGFFRVLKEWDDTEKKSNEDK